MQNINFGLTPWCKYCIFRTDIAFIIAHMKDVDLQELNDNEVLLDSMLFRMIQISENVKRLSEKYKEDKSD